MIDPIKIKFIEEAKDLISDLEKALLVLEESPTDGLVIGNIFRVMHTLKGSSSMFGFEKIGDLTHHLETIYELVRDGKINVSESILNVSLHSVDHLKFLLNNDDQVEENLHQRLLNEVIELANAFSEKSAPILEINPSSIKEEEEKTYYVLFRPEVKILKNGCNPLYLLEDIHALGECKVTAHYLNIPTIDELNVEDCYVYWDIYLSTKENEQAIRDVFMFVQDDCILDIHEVSDTNLFKHKKFIEKINKPESESHINVDELKEFIANLLQIISKSDTTEKVAVAGKETSNSSIRVDNEKIDQLMNLVSELITTQARLTLFAENNPLPELASITENIEKISRQLRDNAFSICLVPIENLLTRYKRLVRDLSKELNKDVVLLIEGGDTELDKSIIENLTDPLLHLLRNCMDHGIESEPERIQANKPLQGSIIFKAFNSGNHVHIQIQDDGKGIDPNKIRRKAIEKGIITAEANLTDKEIIELIFLPGFSTNETVTSVSGRGVGMDVVKRKITELRGELHIDSRLGVGSIFTIKLPLSLSIIDGMLVKVGDTYFILPVSEIDRCHEITRTQLITAFNNQVVANGEKIPFFSLRQEFDITENIPEIQQLIQLSFEQQKVGIVVDQIVGEYQAVLRPLGKLYQKVDILSGATILGDGSVALVMNTHKMIRKFSTQAII